MSLIDKTSLRLRLHPEMPLSLGDLYDRHAQSLFAFLLTITRNESDTRDVLQDVFCRLVRKPHLMRGVRNERAFLLRMAHRIAIDHARSQFARSRRNEAAGVEIMGAQPLPGCSNDGLQEAIAGALAALPEEQAAVVHLKLRAELTFAEIADVIGVSANTAASRYRYALNKLRDQLRPLYEASK